MATLCEVSVPQVLLRALIDNSRALALLDPAATAAANDAAEDAEVLLWSKLATSPAGLDPENPEVKASLARGGR